MACQTIADHIMRISQRQIFYQRYPTRSILQVYEVLIDTKLTDVRQFATTFQEKSNGGKISFAKL